MCELTKDELDEIAIVQSENARKYPNAILHSKESFERMVGKKLNKLAKELGMVKG